MIVDARDVRGSVELGRREMPGSGPEEFRVGEVRYLSDRRVIVAVRSAWSEGCRCDVLAARGRMPPDVVVDVRAAEFDLGHRRVLVDARADPDWFTAVWLARAWVLFGPVSAGQLTTLVDKTREAGTLTLVLDARSRRRTMTRASLSPARLTGMVAGLVEAGVLAPVGEATEALAVFTLRLPTLTPIPD